MKTQAKTKTFVQLKGVKKYCSTIHHNISNHSKGKYAKLVEIFYEPFFRGKVFDLISYKNPSWV